MKNAAASTFLLALLVSAAHAGDPPDAAELARRLSSARADRVEGLFTLADEAARSGYVTLARRCLLVAERLGADAELLAARREVFGDRDDDAGLKGRAKAAFD